MSTEVRWLALTEADWKLLLENVNREVQTRADDDRLSRRRRAQRLAAIRQQLVARSGR